MRVPERNPDEDGEKVIFAAQAVPAPMRATPAQLLVSLKSPLAVMLAMFNWPLPELEMVTESGGELWPLLSLQS